MSVRGRGVQEECLRHWKRVTLGNGEDELTMGYLKFFAT
jgi:hypothetical protein